MPYSVSLLACSHSSRCGSGSFCATQMHSMLSYLWRFACTCRSYYADSGWEDGLPNWAMAKERGAVDVESSSLAKYRRPPHTYSVRPYQDTVSRRVGS